MSSGSRRAPRSDFPESATPESSEAGVTEVPSPESGSDDDEPHKKKPKTAASSARTLGLAKMLKQSKDLEKIRFPPAKRSVITFSFSSSIIIIIIIIITIIITLTLLLTYLGY